MSCRTAALDATATASDLIAGDLIASDLIASDLIARIVSDFHEPHRLSLRTLRDQAASLRGGPAAGAVQALVRPFADALELHMFKEEMRLFPMMEQGGNSLVALLIDDLHRDHLQHGQQLDALRQAVQAAAHAMAGADETLCWQDLAAGLDALAAQLQVHTALEEETLFPMFLDDAACRRLRLGGTAASPAQQAARGGAGRT